MSWMETVRRYLTPANERKQSRSSPYKPVYPDDWTPEDCIDEKVVFRDVSAADGPENGQYTLDETNTMEHADHKAEYWTISIGVGSGPYDRLVKSGVSVIAPRSSWPDPRYRYSRQQNE